MRTKNTRSDSIWILILVLICAGTIVLASFQISWIRQAAVAEKDRFMHDILSGTVRGLYDSLNDLRLIVPVIQQQLSGNTVTHEDITDSIRIWNSRASYPSLLEEILVIDNGSITSANLKTMEYHTSTMSGHKDIGRLADKSLQGDELSESIRDLLQSGYFFIFPDETSHVSLLRSASSSDNFLPSRFIACRLNLVVYLDIIIPNMLKISVPDTVFSVTRISTEEKKYSVFDEHSRYLFFAVPAPSNETLYMRERSLEIFLSPRRSPESLQIPVDEQAIDTRTRKSRPFFPVIANITYPISEGSIEMRFTSWTRRNLFVSLGLLFILLTSFVIMFLLYRKTRRLRTLEQEFVASISHELRLPVTVIKAVSDNLAGGIVSSLQRATEYGREIHNEALRLEHMVESILVYSGIQARSRFIYPQLCDIKAMCSSLIAEIISLSSREELNIHEEYSTEMDDVLMDINGFSIVVQNLLLNAATHAVPADPGNRKEITLRILRRTASRLEIIVSDNGRGIPRRDQRRIFEPFYRTAESVSRQEPGNGLGLHLVRRIARLNDGTVTLESPYRNIAGQMCNGCRFRVQIRIGGTAAE